MMWDKNGRRFLAMLARELNYRAQRGPVQMIEVSVGDKDKVDGRKIPQPNPRLPQSFEDK